MCDAAYQQQKSHRCRITNWMSKLDFEHYRWSVDSVIKKQYELFLGNSFYRKKNDPDKNITVPAYNML